MNFETAAIHAGQEADPRTGAVVTPIYQVSTFKQDGVGGLRAGYEYARSGNPTRDALEECLAALENGTRAFATSSGLAAEDLLLRTVLRPGDHLVVPIDAYGGSYRLFAKVLAPWGIEHTAVDQSDLAAVRAAIIPFHFGYFGVGEDSARSERIARRRQHFRVALFATTIGTRRRRRRALNDEISWWTQRCRRGRYRGQGFEFGRRDCVQPQCDGTGCWAV
jgi:hypothetical protein